MRAQARESANARASARKVLRSDENEKKNSKEGKIVSVFWIRVNNLGPNEKVTNN